MIEGADVALRQNVLRSLPEPSARRPLTRILDAAEQPAQDTLAVRFENGQSAIKGLRENGIACVASQARQAAQDGGVVRESAVVVGDEDAGGAMQIAGTAIIAQSLPQTQHVLFLGGREIGECGKGA